MRSACVGLSVCLSVRWHVAKTRVHISRNVLYMLPVAAAQSVSDDSVIPYVSQCISGLVDDVTLSHNGQLQNYRYMLGVRDVANYSP